MCKGSPPMYLHMWVCMRRGVYAASSSAISWCAMVAPHMCEKHTLLFWWVSEIISLMVLLLLLLHRFTESVCVRERSHWHSTGGFRDTNGRSKTTQVVFFGTHWRHPGNWMDTNPVCECSETLLYTRLPSHLLTGLPWISVSTITYALCCCANIPLVIYVRPIPFFLLFGCSLEPNVSRRRIIQELSIDPGRGQCCWKSILVWDMPKRILRLPFDFWEKC